MAPNSKPFKMMESIESDEIPTIEIDEEEESDDETSNTDLYWRRGLISLRFMKKLVCKEKELLQRAKNLEIRLQARIESSPMEEKQKWQQMMSDLKNEVIKQSGSLLKQARYIYMTQNRFRDEFERYEAVTGSHI